jgi:hypothetical protein
VARSATKREHGPRREIWPWIIGAVALALLLAALASLLGDDDDAVRVRETTPETAPAAP